MAGQGTKIVATDYNLIQSKVSGIIGTGSGSSGYGQTVLSSQVSVNQIISSTQWSNLRLDLLHARQHQTGNTESLTDPTTSVKISEADRSAYNALADLVVTNKLATPPSGQATLATITTGSRSTAWNGTINHTVTVSFGSAEAARFFFNTGSQIRFSASRSGGSTSSPGTKNYSWTSALNGMGNIIFDYNSTTCSGTGNPASIGFKDATTGTQTIFTKYTDTYTPNQYDISMRYDNAGTLTFTVRFQDLSGQPNPPFGIDENVDGTLTSTIQAYYASGSNVSVPQPAASSSGP
jgi:hypothetical protein